MQRSSLWCLFVLATLGVPCASAQSLKPGTAVDIVIRDGKLVDGSGSPWQYGDLAIQGSRIVGMGKLPKLDARRTIDAKGLIVAPGFIDMHSHSEYLLLEDGRGESKIRQGVTTEVFGESDSPGPHLGKFIPPQRKVRGRTERWTTLGEYFDLAEKEGIAPNVVSHVGLGNVWKCVMGTSAQRPTPAQLDEMKELIDQAMKQGARGLSCCLAMPPDGLATTDDLVELCKVVAKHGGIFVVHVRHEGTEVLAAFREVIEIARRAGVRVEILHIKIADQKYWGKMNEMIRLIDDARRGGLDIGANVYPYTRGNNNLSSIIPPWAHEGGTAALLERMKNPKTRVRLKKEIEGGVPGWYNHYTAVGGDWSRMLVNAEGSYKGLTMDRILDQRAAGKTPTPDPLDEFLDLLSEVGGSLSTIFDHHTEKDMNLAMVQPWCSIGSDGLAYAIAGPLRRDQPHPRSFGTFPRVLGRYVRELKILSLEEAVRKMTSLNAGKLGIYDRGLLRPGLSADVVIFDADKVIDKSSYENPFQYPEGIEYVIVNGQVVLDRGTHTGALPGRVLRGPGYRGDAKAAEPQGK